MNGGVLNRPVPQSVVYFKVVYGLVGDKGTAVTVEYLATLGRYGI
jgi:hypothetical protein